MMERTKLGGFRSFLLIIVGTFMGATLITPAVAHVGTTINHLWGAPGHIRAKVQTYGDARWLRLNAKAQDSFLADYANAAGSADFATDASNATFANEADTLDGIDSTGFLTTGSVRADGAQSSANINDFTACPFNVASKAFTAPSNGFLFLVGSISAEDDDSLAGTGYLQYRLKLDSTAVTSSYYELVLAGFGNPAYGLSGAASAVIPVTAGAHIAHLEACETGGGSYITVRSISALFVPSGSGTIPPAATRKAASGNTQGN